MERRKGTTLCRAIREGLAGMTAFGDRPERYKEPNK